MKVYLPQVNDKILEAAKEEFDLALRVSGFTEEAPNECKIATLALNIILEQIDPIAAAVITMWASNPDQDTVTIPLTYHEFHQQVVHLLVRLAYAGGYAEGQAALVSEALEVLDDAFDDADFTGDPILN